MTRYEPFIKHQHTVWDKFTGKKEFQEMLQELSTPEPMKNGQLVEISRQTGVPKNTLKTWRRKLKKNKSYVPEHGRINKEIALPRDVLATELLCLSRARDRTTGEPKLQGKSELGAARASRAQSQLPKTPCEEANRTR